MTVDSTLHQTAPASRSLGHVVGRVVDRVVAALPILEQICDRTTKIEGWLSARREQQQDVELESKRAALRVESKVDASREAVELLHRRLDRIEEVCSSIAQKYECLEHASHRLNLLSEDHFNTRVIEPLSRDFFLIMDVIRTVVESPHVEGAAPTSLPGVLEQMQELLYRLGIDRVEGQVGQEFDPAVMEINELQETSDSTQDRRIARVHLPGYRLGKKVLRHLSVDVHVLKSR